MCIQKKNDLPVSTAPIDEIFKNKIFRIVVTINIMRCSDSCDQSHISNVKNEKW